MREELYRRINALEARMKDMLESGSNDDRNYDEWSARTLGNAPPAPRFPFVRPGMQNSKYGVIVNNAMMEAVVHSRLWFVSNTRLM